LFGKRQRYEQRTYIELVMQGDGYGRTLLIRIVIVVVLIVLANRSR
jgi:hypothetical protein